MFKFIKQKNKVLSTFNFQLSTNRGFSLIEAIVGLSIIFIVLITVIVTYNFFLRISQRNTDVIKAEFLLEEGAEVVRFIRDDSWVDFSNISLETNKYLKFENNFWVVSDENIFIDNKFERKFILNNVYRDVNDDISEIGSLDSDARKITMYVSWVIGLSTTTKQVDFLLTNLFDN